MIPSTKRYQKLSPLLPITALLFLVACSADSTQSSGSGTAATTPKVAITVTDSGCEPIQVTTSAGKTTFVITNKSSQPLEWEILDGVMVVEERENIAPGFVQELRATLEPKEYQMACGLLSNPKGTIIVK